MKKLPEQTILRRNRAAVLLCLCAAALVLILLALPLYSFSSTPFVKRSPNTFAGDEKYLDARAQADAAALAYGPDASARVTEEVIERVNSKGETTSLIIFRVVTTQTKTGYDMIRSGLPFGTALLALTLCAGLAALLMLLSALRGGGMRADTRSLGKTDAALRGAACWLALLALLLTPVLMMSVTYTFERQIIFPLERGTAVNPDTLRAAGLFLFGDAEAAGLSDLLQTLTYQPSGIVGVIALAAAGLLVGSILFCKGAIGHTLARGGLYVFVILLCLLILYPYYVMFITAFRSNAETTDMYFSNLLPTRWIWSNILDIAARGVPQFLGNSLLLSGGATVIALLCGIPAAYAMARMKFRGKKAYLGYVIMSQMFSPVVLLVGIARLMNTIRLNDSVVGLMLINAAFNQAFAIWLLRGTFVSISSEMEQAACIDGCGTVGALIRVLLPMAAPGIVTTLIFVFINSWNEYTISTVLIATPAKKPITVGITQFSSFNMIEWQYLFASALIATIPVIILFMLIEKHLVSGLTSGGVKG